MDAGETSVFEGFVMTHGSELARFARLLTNDRDDAADLTQATLERAYVRWGRVSRADDSLAYVRRMLVNAAIDRTRWRSRQPLSVSLIDSPQRAPHDTLGTLGDRDELRVWLAALPARQRAVVVLRYYVGLTEAETALALGISSGSVKTHASRGLARLRLRAHDEHV